MIWLRYPLKILVFIPTYCPVHSISLREFITSNQINYIEIYIYIVYTLHVTLLYSVQYSMYIYSTCQEICTLFMVRQISIYSYLSMSLHWHWGNHMIAPVPVKQPWKIWVNTSYEYQQTDDIITKQSTIKPYVYLWNILSTSYVLYIYVHIYIFIYIYISIRCMYDSRLAIIF